MAIAEKAQERQTGARGLRTIIEEALLNVMFELPSRHDVRKCVITKETIEKGLDPTLRHRGRRPRRCSSARSRPRRRGSVRGGARAAGGRKAAPPPYDWLVARPFVAG